MLKQRRDAVRYVIYGGMCFAMTLLFLQMVLTVDVRLSRKDELEMGTMFAMNQTMLRIQDGSIENEEQVKTYFSERLGEQIVSNSKIEVQFKKVQLTQGILNVMVREEFNYPMGKKGMIQVEKTAIIDRIVEEGD